MAHAPVLVSWLAYNNDPFERDRRTGEFRPDRNGDRVPGPTLTLLFDEASPYQGKVSDVVMLGRATASDTTSKQRIEQTRAEIQRRESSISVHPFYWGGASPTDHKGLFEFLSKRLPEIRRRFPSRELVLNVSPGTPAMHAVWILVAETGIVEPPFQVVQTVEPRHRGSGGSAVVPVDIGLDTPFKAARASKPARPSQPEGPAFWDPTRFQSDALKRVYDQAQQYAPLDVPVLILGERGTGKTTLASWIRAASPFRKKAQDDHWPSVPCGQYTPETMRSELFGFKKGSFTGATKDHDGLLHQADGDTLFLDEVGDISRELQRLLIRAIEDGSYTPLGSTVRKTSDFRLITATNVPAPELPTRLDLDFLDRISPLRLRVPALREIPDDLDWLWEGVWQEATSRAGVDEEPSDIDHEQVVGRLRDHPLPGNVRDLYRVAYQLLAGQGEMSDAAVDAALDPGLLNNSGQTAADPALATLRASAEGARLDAIYDEHGPIPTTAALTALKRYLAREARGLAARRHLKIDDVTDVRDRTLLNWLKERN